MGAMLMLLEFDFFLLLWLEDLSVWEDLTWHQRGRGRDDGEGRKGREKEGIKKRERERD